MVQPSPLAFPLLPAVIGCVAGDLWAVDEGGMGMEIRHILTPTDFSEVSQRAIDYSFALAQIFRAKLSLLHIIEPPGVPGGERVLLDPIVGLLVKWVCEYQRKLARLLPEAEAARVEVARHVVIGNPSREIVERAAAERVDLIIMATHGRSGLSYEAMGSVAERVVRSAPCPVLTIRPAVERADVAG